MSRRFYPPKSPREARAFAASFNAAYPIGTRVTLDLPRSEGGQETRTIAAARAVLRRVAVPVEGGAEVPIHRIFPVRETLA